MVFERDFDSKHVENGWGEYRRYFVKLELTTWDEPFLTIHDELFRAISLSEMDARDAAEVRAWVDQQTKEYEEYERDMRRMSARADENPMNPHDMYTRRHLA